VKDKISIALGCLCFGMALGIVFYELALLPDKPQPAVTFKSTYNQVRNFCEAWGYEVSRPIVLEKRRKCEIKQKAAKNLQKKLQREHQDVSIYVNTGDMCEVTLYSDNIDATRACMADYDIHMNERLKLNQGEK
jgi:hypothetical protein